MTGIVWRLRAHPGEGQTITEQFRNMVAQRHEAAAEIERLRGHKEEADRHIKTIAELRHKIERLRVVLQEIATYPHSGYGGEIARRELENKP